MLPVVHFPGRGEGDGDRPFRGDAERARMVGEGESERIFLLAVSNHIKHQEFQKNTRKEIFSTLHLIT